MFTQPPAPRSLQPSIPAGIEEVLLIGLRKKPEERFRGIETFAHALEQAAQGALTPEETSLLTQLPASPEIRDLLQKTLGMATVVAVPTVQHGEVATRPLHRAANPTPALPLETPALPITIVAARGSSVTRRIMLGGLAASLVILGGGALAFWQLGTHGGQANTVTPPASPTTTPPPDPTADPTADPTPDPTADPTADPTPDPTSAPPANQPLVYTQGTAAYAVTWNHGGTLVASSGDGPSIQLRDPRTGLLQASFPTGQNRIYDLAWSPNGLFLAAAYSDHTVGIWDTTQNRLATVLNGGHTRQVNSVSWSPDGSYLVSAGGDKTAVIWDVFHKNILGVYTGHTGYVNWAAWSPDGKLIASAGKDMVVQIWNPLSLLTQATGTGHTGIINQLAWSPDSRYVVSTSNDSTARVWDTQGNSLLTYTGHRSLVVAVAWSPDGQKIVTGGGDHTSTLPGDTSAQIWSPRNGQLLNRDTGHTNEIEGLAWSPDSRQVASASDDGTVQIWQV